MKHASRRSRPRRNQDKQPPYLIIRSSEGIADIDDLMRQLSDLVVLPPLCRERACREAERCKGGYGPPCLHIYPEVFVAHIKDGMRDIREFWKVQRAMAAEQGPPAAGEDGVVPRSWPALPDGPLLGETSAEP